MSDTSVRRLADGDRFATPDCVYIIISGTALRVRAAGGRVGPVERLGPGDMVGLDGVLGPARSTEHAFACGPVYVIAAPAPAVQRLAGSDPGLAYALAAQTWRERLTAR